MKKTVLFALVAVMCFGMLASAAPKKIGLVGRISWCPDSEGAATGNRDFDVMQTFSIPDESLDGLCESWGYTSYLMPDYVVQYMINGGEDVEARGYDLYVNPGVYMNQPNLFTDDGYDLAYVTGTCWSSIAPPLLNAGVPVIMGEHSDTASRASKLGSIYMFFGEATSDHRGANTIVLTDAGKTHPLTAGLPDEVQVWGDGPSGPPADPTSAWDGIETAVADAAPGTVVLAVWKDAPDKAALSVIEAGGELANGSTAAQRMAVPFCNGGKVRPDNAPELPAIWTDTYSYMTPAGIDLLRRTVRWCMGEEPAAVGKWSLK